MWKNIVFIDKWPKNISENIFFFCIWLFSTAPGFRLSFLGKRPKWRFAGSSAWEDGLGMDRSGEEGSRQRRGEPRQDLAGPGLSGKSELEGPPGLSQFAEGTRCWTPLHTSRPGASCCSRRRGYNPVSSVGPRVTPPTLAVSNNWNWGVPQSRCPASDIASHHMCTCIHISHATSVLICSDTDLHAEDNGKQFCYNMK